ncbi:low temperature requirement protein A [Arthrobacter cupressi]|uniref:Low temperature requirement protein LtrA n=1 Tax=Arthrobacter cupressi TaxID=1045773 RepID=A0A1G8X8S4_9MICC|nr:low temperature requirement protein A [Arthrobacter cupressi]NYD77738.1 low temperature requirement protein LtrA [Arthrobacter cupressi]SDJ86255.1 Low temperature requirement protein LtrA [Arthrobacter cupressi]
MSNPLRHALSRMGGRDPHEQHRAATPLELFFDLTFVIAFSVAGGQFAHAVAENHAVEGIIGFAIAMFGVLWAWINFSWFASAYDTDDWIFRIVTMVQMVGVLILAMGIEPMFHSVLEGDYVTNEVLVLGYVVMRVALIVQWLRAARQDPQRRKICLTYAGLLAVVQLGWVAAIFVKTDLPTTLMIYAPLIVAEMLVPVIAERRAKTPWHAHHIAERYGLLAIIALGECLIGAIETLRSIVALHGWTMDAALVGLGGTGLAFTLWWVYFILPAGRALHIRRHRAFTFGYGHMIIFAAIAATGAGLHVLAYYIDHEAHISAAAAVASVAIPVAVFKVTLTWIYGSLLGLNRTNLLLMALVVVAAAGAVALAAAGVPVTFCLLVILLAPAVAILEDELAGHRRRAKALEKLGTEAAR